MATYKVLQDIEAEDKLVGPLTLRQCIYAAIALLGGWLSYLVISHGAPYVSVIFLPFIIFGAFFAIPWSKQQSTEVWALAKIRFALKPRKRIWDQSGVKELVTVTAPRRQETGPTINDISETEVRSRLRALADTIDSRGWAVKNVPLGMFAQPYTFAPSTDRLVDTSSLPQQVPDTVMTANDDMFDYANNPVAQQFEDKINAASSAYRQHVMDVMRHPVQEQPLQASPAAAQNYWYVNQPAPAAPIAPAAAIAAPAVPVNNEWGVPQAAVPTPEEEALAQEIKRKQEMLDSVQATSHIRTIQPLSVQMAQAAQQTQQTPVQPATQTAADTTQPPMTDQPNPAILGLANNNDLDVATIAREAQHITGASDEVVVKLH